jgi:hypothetical protein
LEAWGKAGGRRGVRKCCLGDWGGVSAAVSANFVAVGASGLCRVLSMGIPDVARLALLEAETGGELGPRWLGLIGSWTGVLRAGYPQCCRDWFKYGAGPAV